MDQVFGTSPGVTQAPNVSSINPVQLMLQQLVAGQLSSAIPSLFGNVQSGQPALPAPTQFAAPLTNTQTGLIGDIVGNATGGNAPAITGDATTALKQILSGQPQDYSQYFKDSIAAPLENTFSTQTLPAIKAAFAQSAGGPTSTGMNTGYSAAVGDATNSLNQTLQSAMSSLGATAATNAANNQVAGVNAAPNLAASTLQNLVTGLGAATLPQQTQQTQLTGQANWANTALNFLNSILGGGINLSGQGTIQQGNTVVTPGSPGYFGSILGGAGQGAGAGIAAAFA